MLLDSPPPDGLFQAIYELISHVQHMPAPIVGVVSSVGTLVANRAWRKYVERRRWVRRDSIARVNISLNSFVDGKLKIRTIMERPVDTIVHNEHVLDMMVAAAGHCTNDEPVLQMAPVEQRFALECFLNVTAECFISGFTAEDAGFPGKASMYVMFMTCEPAKDQRHRKFRVMLLKQETIADFPYNETFPELERPSHDDRVRTLRRAAQLYRDDPARFVAFEIFTPYPAAVEEVDAIVVTPATPVSR